MNKQEQIYERLIERITPIVSKKLTMEEITDLDGVLWALSQELAGVAVLETK